MNTGASWPDLCEAEPRVLAMQTKLHQWETHHGQAFQRYEYMESRMR